MTTTIVQENLSKLADAAGIAPAALEETLALFLEGHLGEIKLRRTGNEPRVTGAREVFGEGHASVSYVADPNGTAVVPQGYEPPPGYRGRWYHD